MKLPISLSPWILATATLILTACGGSGGQDGEGSNGNSAGNRPDAVVVDIPIAYVRRVIPFDEDEGEIIASEVLEPAQFVPGAELFIRERADFDAEEFNITEGVFPEGELYDVKDLVASNDGTRLLFAMRAPEDEDADDDEQPTWNIWEYNLEEDSLRRIINDDITAEAGEDVSPAYLPDGRIVFSSNRQVRSRAILLDDGKPQYAAQTDNRRQDAYVLHVMDEFGTNIAQLSYNQSHDFQPLVMPSGEILFNRWNNKNNVDRISLFSTRPDGQDTRDIYGFNSQDSGFNGSEIIFHDPKPMADGRILALMRPLESTNWGGDIVAIDVENYSDINQDVNLPISEDPGAIDTLQPGQESLAFGEIYVDEDPDTISPTGYFAAATDLFDDTARLLVAWSDCRLQDPDDDEVVLACIDRNLAIDGIQEAFPLYGLWIYNLEENTLQPLFPATPGLIYTDVVSFGPRPEDNFLADRQPGAELDSSLFDEGLAILHIRNVYEVDGESAVNVQALADPLQFTADERPARFLKIEKAVSLPDRDDFDFDGSAFGFSNFMREIIGYVPVEPDGSVKTLIPADVALTVALTNAAGRRITGTTSTWFTARPGEEIESNDLNVSLNRLDDTNLSTNPGAPVNGYNFPNTQPLLIAQAGETMAEAITRIRSESDDELVRTDFPARRPSVDLVYDDDWTDPAARTPDASFAYRYEDLPHLVRPEDLPDGGASMPTAPVAQACLSRWNAACRIIINYPDHIQHIWDLDQRVFDEADPDLLLEDNTCTSCHNTRDAMGETQIPAAQLELTQSPLNTNNQYRSFLELGANDIEFELNEDGVVVPVMVPVLDGNGDPVPEVDEDGNIVFELDDMGEPILDMNGDPIPVIQMMTVTVPRSLAPNNANGSRFFDLFDAGGSHEGWLTPQELKLISEWIDLGGQYYNDPFDAPE